MADNTKQNDGPVAFVDAKIYTPKSGGARYIWSKTFDLEKVKADLGTNVVTLKVVVPKKKRENSTDEDRLIVFSPSEVKYLPKKKSGGATSGSQSKSSDDIL